MKRVFVITILCTAGIYASGQVLTEITTEAGKLCKELTSVNQGIGRIQGILNNISDCTSDLSQVSAKSNKLSLTPTNKVKASSKPLATSVTGVQSSGTSERVKGIVEVKDEMKAINNRLVRLNEKLVAEERGINQSLTFIENNYGKIKDKLTPSSNEYKCISEQLTQLNTIVGVLQKRAESVFSKASQVLGSFQGQSDCNELIGENCEVISCLNCCDEQFPLSKAGSDTEELVTSEYARQSCRIRCTYEMANCITRRVTDNSTDVTRKTSVP